MSASAGIRPTQADDLESLGLFLRSGFGTAADAPFAAPDVLAWKYLDPRPGTVAQSFTRSWVACDSRGAITGHMGIWPTSFRIVRSGSPVETLVTLHMLDWLGSRASPGVGARLMRHVNDLVELQYGFGGTEMARRVAGRSGYEVVSEVPVLRRVLRAGSSWREGGASDSAVRRLVRGARDAWSRIYPLPDRCRAAVTLERVERFDERDDAALSEPAFDVVYPGRTAAELNVLLAYPRGGLTGWRVLENDRSVGVGVLSVQPRGKIRVGKIADLFLARAEPGLWQSAAQLLTKELKRQRADYALVSASTPWALQAYPRAGFRPAFALQFLVRDPNERLIRELPFHVSFAEVDYATLP